MPRPLIIPDVMTLATLADMRELICLRIFAKSGRGGMWQPNYKAAADGCDRFRLFRRPSGINLH